MAVTRRPRTLVVLSLLGVFAWWTPARAQEPTTASTLAAGIGRIRADDFIGALVTLTDVVNQVAGNTEQAATLARARAYQAVTYTLLDQPERARSFAQLALTADANVVVDAADVTPSVAALFSEVRRSAVQNQNPEAAGDAADRAGGFQEALLAYLRAFQALPEPQATADDRRLREKILKIVGKLGTAPPIIPQEAHDHLTKAQDLLDAEAVLGGGAGTASKHAAAELRRAIRIAPWWPEPMLRYATVMQTLKRSDEALLNLGLYRLADPDGYAAMVDRATPKAVAEKLNAAPAAAPSVGPATIFVYWQPAMRAMGVKPKTLCDDQHVADLQNGRFVRLSAAAGTHTIKVRDRSISGHFDGGQDHYVRVSIEGYPAHLALRFVSVNEATAEMQKRKIVMNDANRTFSGECKAVSARR